MFLDSQKALDHLKLYRDLNDALADPVDVVRLLIRDLKDAAEVARVADFTNLKSLDLSVCDVSQLLPRLGELSKLQHLVLGACRLSSFPGAVLVLSDLRYLDIMNCSLSHVPDEITELARLEWLYFSMNALTRIPVEIGRLKSLTKLNLMHNQLEGIPGSICDLTQLDALILSGNRLVEIPAAIGNLKKLTYLNLECNKLQTLPESVCSLGALESLDLHSNPFTSLPHCLSAMSATEITIEASKRLLFGDWTYPHSKKRVQIQQTELNLLVTPSSPLHESLMTRVEQEGVSSASQQILEVARDAIRIESTVPDDYSHIGGSRLGGFPDLARRSRFPRTDGLYWSFLAQINLSDVAPLNRYLPRQGLLSFFVDSIEALQGKVLYYAAAIEKLTTVRHAGAESMFDSQDDYTQQPHRVRFERFVSLPHQPPAGIESVEDVEAYEKCLAPSASVDHHINGHTFSQLESPQELAANKLGGLPDEWVPLLQLGWDGKVGFCFCDAGTVTFTIHREDLRRLDFSNVHVHLESS